MFVLLTKNYIDVTFTFGEQDKKYIGDGFIPVSIQGLHWWYIATKITI